MGIGALAATPVALEGFVLLLSEPFSPEVCEGFLMGAFLFPVRCAALLDKVCAPPPCELEVGGAVTVAAPVSDSLPSIRWGIH